MNMKRGIWLFISVAVFLISCSAVIAQSVPFGVNYQAVARDNGGNEIKNSKIDVKFSIISENPEGPVVYEEVHTNVSTSPYGVFSLIIGNGKAVVSEKSFSTFSQIRWETAPHFVKVSVKFTNYNDYLFMGTMQFLAVPYALYAQKSLEPGPQGPKGDPGDPATDNQKLSFDGKNLTISENGNTVNLSTLNVAHNLSILGDTLSIYGGNKVGLPNYMQDLQLDNNNILRISKNPGATSIDLTYLKNDADADPTNEIQTITYNPDNFQLSLSKGGGTATMGQIVAFRAGIGSPVALPDNSPVDLTFDQIAGNYYSEGGGYNNSSGAFQAPYTGIYVFSVSLNLPPAGSVILKLTGSPFETIIGPTTTGGCYKESITMRLNKNDIVNIAVKQTNGYSIPSFSFSGYFSGYRIY
jgi:hypothetical protein